MSRLTDFYDVKPSAESFEDATVTTMTVEEFTESVEQKASLLMMDVEDIENADRAIDKLLDISEIMSEGDSKEFTLSTLKGLNVAFESALVMAGYPLNTLSKTNYSESGTTSLMNTESGKENTKIIIKAITEAIMNAIKSALNAFSRMISWFKDKLGIYKASFKAIEEKIKKAGNMKNDTYTVSSIPDSVGLYANMSGNTGKSGSSLDSSLFVQYLNDTKKLADIVVNSVMVMDVPRTGDVISGTIKHLAYSDVKDSPYNKKNSNDYILVVRPKYVITVDRNKVSYPSTKSINDFKGYDTVTKSVTNNNKIIIKVADIGEIKDYLAISRDSINTYKSNINKVNKRVETLGEIVDEYISSLRKSLREYKQEPDDGDGSKDMGIMLIKDTRSQFRAINAALKVAPQATMMYIDVTNFGIKMAKGSLKQYEMS